MTAIRYTTGERAGEYADVPEKEAQGLIHAGLAVELEPDELYKLPKQPESKPAARRGKTSKK